MPRSLPLWATFAEALSLTARHSVRFFAWTCPIAAAGLSAVGAVALLPDDRLVFLFAWGSFALFFFAASCAFFVRTHRMLLIPGEPLAPLLGNTLAMGMWRYARGLAVIAALAVPCALAGWLCASRVSLDGLPDSAQAMLWFVLTYLLVQAGVAKRQLLYLPAVSLRHGRCWRESTAMGRGFGARLVLLNLLSGGYTLGVSAFAGWMVALVIPDGPQGLLECLTVVVGLPAQMGCFACLQAACYRRLSLDSTA